MTVRFHLNGSPVAFDGADDMPLLWYLRDHAKLTGTKFGCGIASCGACTVHVDGRATRSCRAPLASLEGRSVTTIEGLADGDTLHAVQQAWIEEDVPQCGYCQSGQIMSATALLAANSTPSGDDIDQAMSGNVCRCGTYGRIRKGIERAAKVMADATAAEDSGHG